MNSLQVSVADTQHFQYIPEIINTISDSARVRGTGIAKRDPQYIEAKISEGKAIIAINNGKFAGFCYIETWGNKQFVANSGLIVKEEYRGKGVAKLIKQAAFDYSRQRYPDAKIFGLTTGLAVMKINSELGYRPVTFSELTSDNDFWKGCQSCVNYDILQRTERKHCLCTGMLFDPVWKADKTEIAVNPPIHEHSLQVYSRWFRFKQHVLLRLNKLKKVGKFNTATTTSNRNITQLK
ncbi:MAG: GNAT family N-acetyltransferase [Bacteroidales bacterium]|nr:GNAT family N-acetyltransferase [Bacteroidales bacterium]